MVKVFDQEPVRIKKATESNRIVIRKMFNADRKELTDKLSAVKIL